MVSSTMMMTKVRKFAQPSEHPRQAIALKVVGKLVEVSGEAVEYGAPHQSAQLDTTYSVLLSTNG